MSQASQSQLLLFLLGERQLVSFSSWLFGYMLQMQCVGISLKVHIKNLSQTLYIMNKVDSIFSVFQNFMEVEFIYRTLHT
jgi:hypothetical protein